MTKLEKLLKPTPQQIKHRNRLWAEALMANKRKNRECMRSEDGRGRCCLAVAEDVAIACGLPSEYRRNNDQGTPREEVAEFFGWRHQNPTFTLPGNHVGSAASVNDGLEEDGFSEEELEKFSKKNLEKGLSHKQIAECVLNTFVHPSKKKWSFKL